MTETQRSATIQQVLEYLQHNAGTPFRPEELSAMLECGPTEARTALDTLVAAGQIERLQQLNGPMTYVANRSRSPESCRR